MVLLAEWEHCKVMGPPLVFPHCTRDWKSSSPPAHLTREWTVGGREPSNPAPLTTPEKDSTRSFESPRGETASLAAD